MFERLKRFSQTLWYSFVSTKILQERYNKLYDEQDRILVRIKKRNIAGTPKWKLKIKELFWDIFSVPTEALVKEAERLQIPIEVIDKILTRRGSQSA